MINENIFKKSILFWNLKNDEFELLAQRITQIIMK